MSTFNPLFLNEQGVAVELMPSESGVLPSGSCYTCSSGEFVFKQDGNIVCVGDDQVLSFGESWLIPYCTIRQMQADIREGDLMALIRSRLGMEAMLGDDAVQNLICQKIWKATSLINSFIPAKYVLPLTTTPPILNTLSIDLAYCFLHLDPWNDLVEEKYARAMEMLNKVAQGKIRLDSDDSSSKPVSKGSCYVPVGSKESLESRFLATML